MHSLHLENKLLVPQFWSLNSWLIPGCSSRGCYSVLFLLLWILDGRIPHIGFRDEPQIYAAEKRMGQCCS